MQFINPSQMTVPLYSRQEHTITTTEFKALSFEQRKIYLKRHDSKRDIMNVAKEMIEVFNYNTAQKNLLPVIMAMDENKIAEFFRYFVYAAIPLADNLYSDMRNQAAVDFFKKLVVSPFDSIEINMPLSHITKKTMSQLDENRTLEIKTALDKFLNLVEQVKNNYGMTEAEIAGILAVALTNQHPTIQQSLVSAIFNSGIALAAAHAAHEVKLTDTGLLAILKTFCQLSENVYFPYI